MKRQEEQVNVNPEEIKSVQSREMESLPLHEKNKKIFGFALIAIEIIVIIFYGIFVRVQIHSDQTNNTNSYPMYQNINVMILIGFLFLRTFAKNNAQSSISYTFFINAVIVQLYFLWQTFWSRSFDGGWTQDIEIVEKSFIKASYSVAAVLVSFGAVLGRVGPLELLIMALVEIFGYTLNERIIYDELGVFDAGGSSTIHIFGAYFGLTVSLVLSKVTSPVLKLQRDYYTTIFSLMGTLFLWMYWPSFNAGFYGSSPYQKSIIIINTILALTGSCIGTFVISSFIRQKFNIQDILNGTLAGGVIIGAPSGLFTNPAAGLCIGVFAGVLATFGLSQLSDKFQKMIGLNDTCSIHNLHGLPGILGSIFSAIAIASYSNAPLKSSTQKSSLPFYQVCMIQRTFYQQGGYQIAGIVVSMLIAVIFGVIAGNLIKLVPSQKSIKVNKINSFMNNQGCSSSHVNIENNYQS